jgi:hypothetical protein
MYVHGHGQAQDLAGYYLVAFKEVAQRAAPAAIMCACTLASTFLRPILSLPVALSAVLLCQSFSLSLSFAGFSSLSLPLSLSLTFSHFLSLSLSLSLPPSLPPSLPRSASLSTSLRVIVPLLLALRFDVWDAWGASCVAWTCPLLCSFICHFRHCRPPPSLLF